MSAVVGGVPRPLGWRHWLWFGLLAVLLAGLIAYERYDAYTQTRNQELKRLQVLTRVVNDNLSIHLQAMDKLLLGARDRQAAQALSKPSRLAASLNPDELRYLVETTAGVRTLAIIDTQGNFLSSNRSELIGQNFADRPYFRSARTMRDPSILIISEPFKTRLNIFALNLSRPILGPRGEFLGAVVLTLDPEFFKSMLSSVLYADDLRCLLVHQDGILFQSAGDSTIQVGINLAKPGSLFSIHMATGQRESFVTAQSYSTQDQRMGVLRNVTPDDLSMDKHLVLTFTRNVDQVFADWKKETVTVISFYLLLLLAGGSWCAFYQRQRNKALLREMELDQERQATAAAQEIALAAQQLLVNSQETLQLAQSVGRIGSFAMGSDTEKFTYTAETARIFGLSGRGEATFSEWFACVHPDDLAAVEAAWRAALQGEPYDITYRITVHGGIRWIRALAGLQFDDRGNPVKAVGTVQDISDLKLAEEAQRKLLDILDQSPDMIASATLDKETKTTYINPAGRDYLGIAQDVPPPADAMQRAYPAWAYRKVVDEGIPAALKHGNWLGETALLQRATGREIPVSQLIIAHRDKQGQAVLLSTIIRDITDRKRIEQQLADEQKRFRDFSASTADWFWEMDADLHFSYLSDNFEQVYGLKPEFVLGKSRPELLARDRLNPQSLVDPHVAQLEKHESFRDFEYRIRDAEGNVRWISISGIPFFDQKGDFAGYRGIGQVVSDRKKAELDLRESQERLEAAASAGIVGVWDWDVVNNRLVWDKVMYRLFGIPENDFAGAYEAWFGALHPDDRPQAESELQAALRGEREYVHEFRIIWPDRSIRYIKAVSHTTFDESGQPLRMVGVNYDVTEQKNIEAMLEDGIAKRTHELAKARDAAEVANMAKSAFLANVSHEMRTPLHQIYGMAQLIRRESLTPRQIDRFAMLDSATEKLTAIIDGVLALTKLESEQLELVEEVFSPQVLLDEVVASVEAQAAAKQLRLIVAEIDAPAAMVGDKRHIRQALFNYVSNAVRFTEEGTISIRLKKSAEVGNHLLMRFEVEDKGIGIALEDIPRLFSIFEQVDNSATRKFGGLGMGLAMTRKIAEIMGGEAGCDSSPDQGSTFWFTVRLKKA